MPSSIPVGPAAVMDGISTDASVLRTFLVSAFTYNEGTLSAADTLSGVLPGLSALQVTAPGGMLATVSSGFCVIEATLASNGAYSMGLMAQGNLTVQTADPVNPRIDLVCATIIDNGNSTSLGEVQIIPGTPAPSPAVPSLPAQSIPLAQVAVAAGATTITSGNISDVRTFTAAAGGVIPVQGLTAVPQGYPGAYCHDLVTGRLIHNPAGTAKQPVLLPFAPVEVVSNSGSDPGTAGTITLLTATVTTDGLTDIAISVKWASLYANSGGSGQIGTADMQIWIDSTQVDSMIGMIVNGSSGPNMGGGAYTHTTGSATSDTPTAGSHTIAWKMHVNYVGSDFIYVHQGAGFPMVLRVSAVPL